MNIKNVSNQYVNALPVGVFDRTPKAVWAAIAISFALCDNDGEFDRTLTAILDEWEALYLNHIVSQKPIQATEN